MLPLLMHLMDERMLPPTAARTPLMLQHCLEDTELIYACLLPVCGLFVELLCRSATWLQASRLIVCIL